MEPSPFRPIKKLTYTADTISQRLMQSIENMILMKARSNKIYGIDAEDVAQELRLHVWRNIAAYNPERSRFITWAMTIVNNKMIDMSRARSDMLDPTNINYQLINQDAEKIGSDQFDDLFV